ncbi:biotin transporter BioY [Myxosarcina sp. GI1(2024)]
MSNLESVSKPNADITDYEWEVTPPAVKAILHRLERSLQQKQQNLEYLKAENRWLRQQLDLELNPGDRVSLPALPEVLLWATIGLILTVACTFIPAHTIAPPWTWRQEITTHYLGVSYQVGAVLFVACVGGKHAGWLSQLTYLLLGLTGLSIFDRGGGWQYFQQPNFGYLLGFVFGAWLCGYLAFQSKAKLHTLISSCLAGLLAIHLTGIVYLTGLYFSTGLGEGIDSWWQGISIYSLTPLPGQIAVICVVTLIASILRKIMFS